MNSSSVRLGQDFKDFLRKFKANRIKAEVTDDIISSVEAASLIVKYFKNNNERYLELIRTEGENV